MTREKKHRPKPKRLTAPRRPRPASPRRKSGAASSITAVSAEQRGEIEHLVKRRVEDVAQGFVSLASELWIVKDRLSVLEQVLEQHGIPASAVDNFEPSGEFKNKLDAARRAFAQRVVAGLFPRGMPKPE